LGVCATLVAVIVPSDAWAQTVAAQAAAPSQAVPADRFVKNVTEEILNVIKQNKQALLADPKKMNELVDTKVLPHVNFKKMTAQVVGRSWRDASADQKIKLTDEFRLLLIRTYSGALAQVKDQQIQVKPLRSGADDADLVVVQSLITRPKGEPIQLDYRVERAGDDWKIYDVNVGGIWLIETYRTQFTAEVNKTGIDGLIKTLSEKNRAG
jgi:phospholipid transport system substrate-binding protein